MTAEQAHPLMSEEQLKAFLEKANADQSIQDKLKAAKSPEDVVAIAKEHGHEFTADKINQLSDEELEGVAGGTVTHIGARFLPMCAGSIICSKDACDQAPS